LRSQPLSNPPPHDRSPTSSARMGSVRSRSGPCHGARFWPPPNNLFNALKGDVDVDDVTNVPCTSQSDFTGKVSSTGTTSSVAFRRTSLPDLIVTSLTAPALKDGNDTPTV